MANSLRQKAEDALKNQEREFRDIKDQFIEKDQTMIAYKSKYESEARKVLEAERKIENLLVQIQSMEKQSEIQRKQLLDKIMQQNEQITAEKDTREIWINRYEKEQKAHIQTHTDLNGLQTKFHELDLNYSNTRNTIESMNDNKVMMLKQLKDLQTSNSKANAEIERLKRELFTAEELNLQAELNFKE